MTTSGMSCRQEVSHGREASPEDSCARRKLHFEEPGEEIEPLGRDPRLQDVQGLLTIVDGTLLAALPKMTEASLLERKTGSGMVKWRLHTHFERGPVVLLQTPDAEGSVEGMRERR
jgi:hypothetical protein